MKTLIFAAAVCCGVLSTTALAAAPMGICTQGGAFTLSEKLIAPVNSPFPFNYAQDNTIHLTNGDWAGTPWTYTTPANCVTFNITPYVKSTLHGWSKPVENYVTINPSMVAGLMSGNTLNVTVNESKSNPLVFCVTNANFNNHQKGITLVGSANCPQ